ncbi:MAG: biotin transporter BioY [Thermoleophilia bacterium]
MSSLSARHLTYAALFAALTAVGAFISVPVGAVPFTLQVVVVLLAGLQLGPWLGALSMCAYLLVGMVAPVYAGGTSGIGVLFGPTGGYLWGFVFAAWSVGWLRSRIRDQRLLPTVAISLAGLLPIYALGTLWLATQQHIGWYAAIGVGVAPFVLFDAVKTLVAALAARALTSLPLGLREVLRPR